MTVDKLKYSMDYKRATVPFHNPQVMEIRALYIVFFSVYKIQNYSSALSLIYDLMALPEAYLSKMCKSMGCITFT